MRAHVGGVGGGSRRESAAAPDSAVSTADSAGRRRTHGRAGRAPRRTHAPPIPQPGTRPTPDLGTARPTTRSRTPTVKPGRPHAQGARHPHPPPGAPHTGELEPQTGPSPTPETGPPMAPLWGEPPITQAPVHGRESRGCAAGCLHAWGGTRSPSNTHIYF